MAYLHRPGRNSDSPGDPPPRWGLRRRRERMAVAAAVIAGLVIGLVLTLYQGAAGWADSRPWL